MSDMLVKLYDLKDDWGFLSEQEHNGIIIRKPIGPEKHLIVEWVREKFYKAWASEADVAMSNRPKTCFMAVQDGQILGFACYDATALGFFGPIAVAESFRGKGTGKAMLLACMLDMKLKGYGYAVIGNTENLGFYEKHVGAVEIPESSSGIYSTWVRADKRK
ncbi:MAG: GNAT family N-acetyltransferase [Deltaproteobacteria bacterium]|nr:GNAT family N-acetyltransferase [Deltaproteobacteria bacterium]